MQLGFDGKYKMDMRVTIAANPEQGNDVQSTYPIHIEVTGTDRWPTIRDAKKGWLYLHE